MFLILFCVTRNAFYRGGQTQRDMLINGKADLQLMLLDSPEIPNAKAFGLNRNQGVNRSMPQLPNINRGSPTKPQSQLDSNYFMKAKII